MTSSLKRLDDQIEGYDTRSETAQRRHKLLKLLQIVTAALIPLVTVFDIPRPTKVTAILGMCVLVFEGVQQLK